MVSYAGFLASFASAYHGLAALPKHGKKVQETGAM
jgi:hypothetical protein